MAVKNTKIEQYNSNKKNLGIRTGRDMKAHLWSGTRRQTAARTSEAWGGWGKQGMDAGWDEGRE
jgi:hypothetical protein